MTRIPWAAIGAAAILVSCSNPTRISMPTLLPKPIVTALQGAPAHDLNSIRLIPGGKGASAAGLTAGPGGGHDLAILDLESVPAIAPVPLRLLPSPFGKPFWDIESTAEGYAAVWSVPGSEVTFCWPCSSARSSLVPRSFRMPATSWRDRKSVV